MGFIKPPRPLTFLAAVALTILVAIAQAGVAIPAISGNEFGFLMASNILFILGCSTQGL